MPYETYTPEICENRGIQTTTIAVIDKLRKAMELLGQNYENNTRKFNVPFAK